MSTKRLRQAGSQAIPVAEASGPPAVTIQGLTVVYNTASGELPAVREVDLELAPGSITGLVGESGSGKSTMALSMLNAVQSPGRISAGQIRIDDIGDVLGLEGERLRAARGGQIGYVFQAAQNSLNPLKRVGKQLLDLGRSHGVTDLRQLTREAIDLLGRMGLDGKRVLDSYQHELSGGMRQRVGIMLALVLNAHLVVLDEPTTALDMLTQATILQIIRDIHRERGLTTLVVTHDIGVVAEVADRIAVMYGGRLVEQGPTRMLLGSPQHPYTRGLIRAIPRLTGDITVAEPLAGRPPTLTSIPQQGCVFRDRCPLAMSVCETTEPETRDVGGTLVACHAVEDQASAGAAVDATNQVAKQTTPSTSVNEKEHT